MIIDLRQGAADLRADLHDLLGRVDDQVSHVIQDLRDHLDGDRVAHGVEVTQVNLVSDGSVAASHTDVNLVNAWGASYTPTGPFWISDNGTGVATLYDGSGNAFPAGNPLVVTIPAPPGSTEPSTPTGQVFNAAGTGFVVAAQSHTESGTESHSASARFLFATEDGTISGWNPTVDATNAILAVDHSGEGAVYKGLAIASHNGQQLLYAADFHGGTVDVYDQDFREVNSFTDRSLPEGYAPFNVQVLDGHLYVAFALQDADGKDDVAGAGHGFVDKFDLDGNLLQRVASHGPLDSPWGLDLAPASFGRLAGDLLVGNFGDGTINVFDPDTNHFLGKLADADGRPIQIDGLWALINGNGATGGDQNTVYFTAGPGDEEHGLFGSLTPQSTGGHFELHLFG